MDLIKAGVGETKSEERVLVLRSVIDCVVVFSLI
jgi:hypothetical protein